MERASTPAPPLKGLTLGLHAYRAGVRVLTPWARRALTKRAKIGKEDPSRLSERWGWPGMRRPEGPIIWMHGASVGESLLLLPLVDAVLTERPDTSVLITTGTKTSAKLMGQRLPTHAVHQYVPIDHPDAVRRFLDHWRPGLAVFSESDLWPNLMLETQARNVPMALVNARMTEKSLKSWRLWRGALQRMCAGLVWIGAADGQTAEGLSTLLERPVEKLGNLKYAAKAPEANAAALASFQADAGPRARVWLAASTHDGEEDAVIRAHGRIREHENTALLILAPRHPERGDAVTGLARAAGFETAQRSAGEGVHDDTAVYVADTLGEMALWYALAGAAFIGGSLVEGVGGHTPLEPAQAGTAIFTGPHTHNFAEPYAELIAAGAAVVVNDAQGLAEAIGALTPARARAMAEAAGTAGQTGQAILDATLAALRPHLPEPAEDRAYASA